MSNWRHLRAFVFPLGLHMQHTFDVYFVSGNSIGLFFYLCVFDSLSLYFFFGWICNGINVRLFLGRDNSTVFFLYLLKLFSVLITNLTKV